MPADLPTPPPVDLPANARVYLVGAGPGDPRLMTLRAVECLQRADVILYDYLVNPGALVHAGPAAQQVCLGAHGRTRIWSQEEINEELVRLAKQGLRVVRLKGGDPAVFARGAEELEFLQARGIPFEVVPGITAALAASSYAGIPITHREHASAVALVTGQQRSDAPPSSADVDFKALAQFPGTLVIYMGVTTAERWTSALIQAGKDPKTPAAVIRRCSLPDQQTIRCTLDEVASRLAPPHRVRPPAIVIVGAVAGLNAELDWFERQPLFGQTVLVTRPAGSADSLSGLLAEQGARVLHQAAIEIHPPSSWDEVDRTIDELDRFDWLVFSSGNGVRGFLDRLQARGLDARRLGSARLAVVGPGTARTLARYHLQADLQPQKAYRAEDLAAALADEAPGQRFLWLRADRGREVLGDQLRAAGGEVTPLVVYRSLDTSQPDASAAGALEAGEIDWVTVTSSAIARSLHGLFGPALKSAKLISISPLSSATLRELGHDVAAEARQATMESLVEAMTYR